MLNSRLRVGVKYLTRCLLTEMGGVASHLPNILCDAVPQSAA